MEEETLVGQIGLLLTQLRYARRALEDVERSTARYGSYAFAEALSGGSKFGEPPLQSGALRVFVVNINDLQPGGGWGGLFETVFGGIGRFLGGFLGGIAGGVLGGFTVPALIGWLDRVTQTMDRVTRALGLYEPAGPAAANVSAGTTPPPNIGGPPEQSNLLGTLQQVTSLFRAASGSSNETAEGQSARPPDERWLAMVSSINALLTGASHIVDGLILFAPILVGTLAAVINRLHTIQATVVELLQFALRNVFLLRGVILLVIFDTLAAAAKLAGDLLGIIATAVNSVLTAAFRIIGDVLTVAISGIRFVAGAIQRTVDPLVRWALNSLYGVLAAISQTQVFRLLVHALQILPAILPGLVLLVQNKSVPNPTELSAIANDKIDLSGGGSAPPSSYIPNIPDLAGLLLPKEEVDKLEGAVKVASDSIISHTQEILGPAQGALARMGTRLAAAGKDDILSSNERIRRGVQEIEGRSADLAGRLTQAREAAAQQGDGPLDQLARGYEEWLRGSGFRTMMTNLNQHFENAPVIPQAVASARTERPPATIEIDDVYVDVRLPEAAAKPGAEAPLEAPAPEGSVQLLLDLLHELEERGMRFAPGAGLLQVHI